MGEDLCILVVQRKCRPSVEVAGGGLATAVDADHEARVERRPRSLRLG